ncbi:MAG: class I SAM-dependent methyltransferase [Myxococcales bacterium]|nr:class I SAM-dependent methyltransferase [Myxococcota bacterium]MDW8283708.1 class I SAM-dependent methyltransferase [Myxococcales bacterium]
MYAWLAPDPADAGHRARVCRLYDRLSGSYSARRRRGVLRWLAERDARAIWALLEPRPGLRVLDAGCGDGRHAAMLTAQGLRVWAVDFAPGMAAAAAAHVERALCLDIEDLDLGICFDRVLCIGALEFATDPVRCLEGLARHVLPGGRLVVQVPRRSPLALPYALWQRLRHGVHVHLLEGRLLDEAARRQGLRLRAQCRPFVHTLLLCWERPPT